MGKCSIIQPFNNPWGQQITTDGSIRAKEKKHRGNCTCSAALWQTSAITPLYLEVTNCGAGTSFCQGAGIYHQFQSTSTRLCPLTDTLSSGQGNESSLCQSLTKGKFDCSSSHYKEQEQLTHEGTHWNCNFVPHNFFDSCARIQFHGRTS